MPSPKVQPEPNPDAKKTETDTPTALGSVCVVHQGLFFQMMTLESDAISDSLMRGKSFYEEAYLERLKSYIQPGDLVLDIGAHVGNHTLYFAKVCGARVVAFEPNPRAFQKMMETLIANGVRKDVSGHNIALSDGSKSSIVLTPLSMDDTAPSGDPGTMSAYRERNENSIERPCKALDDFADYFAERSIALIKIDVELSELDVLKGGRKVIEAAKPVIGVEVMSLDQFNAVDKYLSQMGYRPIGIFNATPTVIWECTDAAPNRDIFEYAIHWAVAANKAALQRNEAQHELALLKETI